MISKERFIKINDIDVAYRDIGNCEHQFEVMKYILDFLTDKQLKEIEDLIRLTLKREVA
jgi:hypothetical protein